MEVISTRRYEARPPANSVHPGLIFDPQNSIATIKEEEWETRKKKEITTTRQIETRVKRQVVLEDGEVVKDSGPLVTTNTTEDVEQQEHTTQERKTNGDDPKEIEWPIDGKESGGIVVQKKLNETVIRSREETEELLETEDRRQLGDITDEAYQQAIKNNRGDIRISLAESSKQLAVKTGPRVLQHTTKSNKVIDTEKTLERKELKPDGQIVTETKKTVEHEEIRDVPADENAINNDDVSETKKESSQRFLKKREEDVVDYISGGEKIAREMRYVSEITEGERIGDWPPPPDTMRTVRLPKPAGLPSDTNPMNRKDALTKKPLDPEEEDEARKFETSKWLENHFGSESRSSHSSDHDNVQSSPIQTATNTSFINVTMKSCTPRDRDYKNPSNNNNNHNHHQQQQQQQQQQRKISARESGSPSGYFHGISEWSERFQGSDNLNGTIPANSSKHYVVETSRTNGSLSRKENPRNHGDNVRQQKDTTTYTKNYETTLRKNHESHNQRTSPPSPPVRRRLREQVTTTRLEEKNSYPEIRGSSPVNVVQRTWENRSREKTDNNRHEKIEIRHYSPVKSRSPSPVILKTQAPPPVRRDKKKSTIDKSNQRKTRSQSPIEQTKSKIGESFRKLVGKLRSVSSERKNGNKKNGSSSVSQLTQTDDDSTYLQYNVIDKNIPEIIGDDEVDMNKPPERPPRSSNSPVTKTIKVTRTNGSSSNDQYKSRNGNSTPHRYYISEESYTSSKSPYDTRINDQRNHYKSSRNNIDHDSVNESSTLDRFSKSTSRLINGNDNKYYSTTQTLPKKLNYKNNTMSIQSSNHHPTITTTKNHTKQIQTPITSKSNQSRHYNSMINISIKNSVTSPTLKNIKNIKNNNNHLQNSNNKLQNYKNSNSSGNSSIQSTLYSTVKHDNNYKTSLLRSKSFNVEANNNNNNINNKNINGDNTHRIPYKSNTQLNRLDETPPLKSPGILASISRSNRDLFRHDYY